MYIVFEGIVGTGKSTQSKNLVKYLQQLYPEKEIILVREPGSTPLAEAIRILAQGPEFAQEMHPICETYLYAASRAQLLYNVVQPARERGAIIVSDRSVISSIAYQGFARGVGFDKVRDVNRQAIISCVPDMIIYLQVSHEIASKRALDDKMDKFDMLGADFFAKVVAGYEKASQLPLFRDKRHIVDATSTVEDICTHITELVSSQMKKL